METRWKEKGDRSRALEYVKRFLISFICQHWDSFSEKTQLFSLLPKKMGESPLKRRRRMIGLVAFGFRLRSLNRRHAIATASKLDMYSYLNAVPDAVNMSTKGHTASLGSTPRNHLYSLKYESPSPRRHRKPGCAMHPSSFGAQARCNTLRAQSSQATNDGISHCDFSRHDSSGRCA